MARYYAVRPINMPDHIRIEKADNPVEAIMLAFGRGLEGFEAKDLGTRARAFESDKRRIAMLNDPTGWASFGKEKKNG